MPKKVIGLDSGKHSLKAVELERGFRGYELIRRFSVQRAPQNGDLPSIVHMAFGEEQPDGDIWTTFPLKEVTSRLLRLPFSSASKLAQIVPFELEGNVPFGVEEMVVDHHSVESLKSSSWVLAAGARREKVAGRLGEMASAGLNPRGLVPEGYAYRSLAGLLQSDQGAPFAFLDIGASHTIFVVGMGNRVVAGRSISVGGDEITDAIAEKTGTSFEVSEAIKLSPGARRAVVLDSAARALKPVVDQVNNSLRFLKAEEGIGPGRIYLCGGSANMEGIESLLNGMLDVPVEKPSLPELIDGTLGPEDALALALALEDVNPTHGVNFRKGEFAYRSETTVFREKLVFPAVLLLLIIAFFNINSLMKARIMGVELNELKARNTAIVKAILPNENISPKDAVKKLRSEIERLKKLDETLGELAGLSPLQLLTALSELTPPDLQVDLESLNMTERFVVIEGVIPEHSDMDVIIQQYKNFKAFKRFDTPDLRSKVGGGVKFSLRIFLTEEGEGEGGG